MPKSSKDVRKSDSQKSKKTIASAKSSVTKKKRKTKRPQTYKTFIYKVLKQVHPQAGISSKAMNIMDCFIKDIFERLAAESSTLVKLAKRKTLSGRDIQSATYLLLPGELAKHAVSEGTKAVTKFTSSRQ